MIYADRRQLAASTQLGQPQMLQTTQMLVRRMGIAQFVRLYYEVQATVLRNTMYFKPLLTIDSVQHILML